MDSNSLMFMLLLVFVILTLVALAMCFMKNTNTNVLNTVSNVLTEEEQLVYDVNNLNRTYNRFYWGNNELH